MHLSLRLISVLSRQELIKTLNVLDIDTDPTSKHSRESVLLFNQRYTTRDIVTVCLRPNVASQAVKESNRKRKGGEGMLSNTRARACWQRKGQKREKEV